MVCGEEGLAVDFALTPTQLRLQQQCRALAADFPLLASGGAHAIREASHPVENYAAAAAGRVSVH